MKTKLLLAITFVLMVAVIGAGTATATPPSGLTSELLARGAAGNFSIKGENFDLTIKAKDATDLAMVKATLTANGFTGWHEHPGPSVVLVKQGTLTLREPHDGARASRTELGKLSYTRRAFTTSSPAPRELNSFSHISSPRELRRF